MGADYNVISEREGGFWQGLYVGLALGALLSFWILYGGLA